MSEQKDLFDVLPPASDLGENEQVKKSKIPEMQLWEVTYAKPVTVYLMGHTEKDVRKQIELDSRFRDIKINKHFIEPVREKYPRKGKAPSCDETAELAVCHHGDPLHDVVFMQLIHDEELQGIVHYYQVLCEMQANQPFDVRHCKAVVGELLETNSFLYSRSDVHRTYLLLSNLLEQLEGVVPKGVASNCAILWEKNTSVVEPKDYVKPAQLVDGKYHVKYKKLPGIKRLKELNNSALIA